MIQKQWSIFVILDYIYGLKLFPVFCYAEEDGRGNDGEKVENHENINLQAWLVHARRWNQVHKLSS